MNHLHQKFIKYAIIVSLIVLVIPNCFSQNEEQFPPLPLDAVEQLKDGLNPRVTIDSGGPRNGHFRIVDNGWWMFFLHLRPLEGAKSLTSELTREYVTTFWASDFPMQAELTGQEGVFEVNGKKVYWAEALFGNGTVQTRFLVWDDPANNRRIFADCNINLRRGTPDSILTVVQKNMALSLITGPRDASLEQVLRTPLQTASFDDISVSFQHPLDCHAETYPGFDEKRGELPPSLWSSIWVLPVGIEWRFDLAWGPFGKLEPEEWIADNLPDVLSGNANMSTETMSIEEIYENQWMGEAVTSTVYGDQKAGTSWKIAAATWDNRGRTFRTVVACRIYRDWWGFEFDGVVSNEDLNSRIIRWINRIRTAPVWMGDVDNK